MVGRVFFEFLLQFHPLYFCPVGNQAENVQQAFFDPVNIKAQPVTQFVAGFGQVATGILNVPLQIVGDFLGLIVAQFFKLYRGLAGFVDTVPDTGQGFRLGFFQRMANALHHAVVGLHKFVSSGVGHCLLQSL